MSMYFRVNGKLLFRKRDASIANNVNSYSKYSISSRISFVELKSNRNKKKKREKIFELLPIVLKKLLILPEQE